MRNHFPSKHKASNTETDEYDAVVPRLHVAEFITYAAALRQKYRVRIRSFVHAGVGFAGKPFSEQSLQPEAIALMRSIKRAFDPDNILNPGEFFD